MRDGLADLIKTGLGILGVTRGLKDLVAAAGEQGQMLMTAKYANMSVDALENWTSVVAETGKAADGFVTSLEALNTAFIKMGSMGEAGNTSQLFKELNLLGLTPSKELSANSDQRVKDILNAAMRAANQARAREIVKDLLGQSGLDVMLLAQQRGYSSIDPVYNAASGRAFRNPNRAGGLEGVVELREIGETFRQIFGAFSSTVLKDLKPTFEHLLTWLGTHKQDIENLIEGMSKLTEALLKFVGGTLGAFLSAPSNPEFQAGGAEGWAAGHPFLQGMTAVGKNWSDYLEKLIYGPGGRAGMIEGNKAFQNSHFHVTIENESQQRLRIAKVVAEGSAGLLYQTNLMNQLK